MINKFAVILILLSVLSCKKDVQNETVQSAQDKSFAQMQFLDVLKNTLELLPLYVINSNAIESNIEITSTPDISSATYPKTVTINYGETNTDFSDGKTRSGKVIVTLSGSGILKDPFVISFDNFYLNETLLLGSINVVYNASSSSQQFDITINNDIKCSNANGTMSWNGSGVLTRTGGESTITVLDDVYSFSESTKGQDFKGRSYESKSSKNYTVVFNCRWLVVSGVSNFSPFDLKDQVLDYGDNTCDGKVEVTPSDAKKPFYFILQ